MKLSCSDFTGGWSAAPAVRDAEGDEEGRGRREWSSAVDIPVAPAVIPYPEPSAPEGSPTSLGSAPCPDPGTPSADALADALEHLFDRTDENPVLPFHLETPVDTRGLAPAATQPGATPR